MVLTLLAALAIVTFLRGFLTGLQQLILINLDAEHLEHARTRAMWGMMQLWAFFGIWEAIRLSLAFIQGETIPHTTAIVVCILLVVGILFLLPLYLFPKKAGGGH